MHDPFKWRSKPNFWVAQNWAWIYFLDHVWIMSKRTHFSQHLSIQSQSLASVRPWPGKDTWHMDRQRRSNVAHWVPTPTRSIKFYQILSTCRLWAQAHIPNHPKSSQNPNITSCLTGICAGAMEATANDFWARLALKLFGAMLNRLALLFLWGTEGDIFLKELSILVSRLVRGCCKSSQNCPIHTSTKLLIMPYRTVELCFIL